MTARGKKRATVELRSAAFKDLKCLKARSHENSRPGGCLSKDCPAVGAALYPSAESPVVILTRFTRFGIPAAITVPCSWIVGKIKRERT